MTREDIIRMANKAGFELCRGDGWPDERLLSNIEKFANIVAAESIRARGKELSSQDNLSKSPTDRRYTCHVCNSQEMVRAKFDEESG